MSALLGPLSLTLMCGYAVLTLIYTCVKDEPTDRETVQMMVGFPLVILASFTLAIIADHSS